jgi:hypothetical protein
MPDSKVIDIIKREVREEQFPYFNEDDFTYYLEKNGGDVNATIYEMLLIKSEVSSIVRHEVQVYSGKRIDNTRHIRLL